MGVPLGHRGRIKLALQRFFPHLMSQEAQASGGAISPSHALGGADSSAAGAAVNGGTAPASAASAAAPGGFQMPGLSSGGGYNAGFPSHYVSAGSLFSQPAGGSQPPSAASYDSGQESLSAPPLDFLCPITHDVMVEPVLAADGHSYEHESIARWLRDHKTSPVTGKILSSKQLTPNLHLRELIQHWKQTGQIMQYK